MAKPFYPEYPPKLNHDGQAFALTSLKDWSIAHGLAVRPAPSFISEQNDPEMVLATTAPVTIFPSLFPRSCFEQGLEIQKAYNKLYSAIARDVGWLRPIITE
jgi:glutathione synthase